MDPQPPRRQPGPPTTAAPTRLRAVVALVRPCSPNRAVLAAAADLAADHGCALLVLGTLDRMAVDWVDGLDLAGPVIEAAHGELFASCVETLWDRRLAWGVNVLWGRVGAETLALADRVDLVRVVHGPGAPATLARRLRRRLTGDLPRQLRDLDCVVG